MPLSAWNFLSVQKSSLDLESTDALLAKVLVFTSSQAELLEDSFEGQLEVLLKPLRRLSCRS